MLLLPSVEVDDLVNDVSDAIAHSDLILNEIKLHLWNGRVS